MESLVGNDKYLKFNSEINWELGQKRGVEPSNPDPV